MIAGWANTVWSTVAAAAAMIVLGPTPEQIAEQVLQRHPLIDLHVDLPAALRLFYRGDVSHVDYRGPLIGQVDLNRLEKGRSGGLFSVAFAECPETSPVGGENATEAAALLLQSNEAVRDTLEQIDVTHELARQYSQSIGLATRARDALLHQKAGRVSHFIGIEGAHSLGNSLGTLRMFYNLGVRYLTLTHVCHNAFADTAGSTAGKPARPLHGGLSPLGRRLVAEMNRLGMIVDVSHTSDDTARQAIAESRAPIIFSHSGARSVYDHIRNVPDDVLAEIAEGNAGGRDAVVGVPFLPDFIAKTPAEQTLEKVADHLDHIARIAGKSRVAIGSDFDGFPPPPIRRLEDVSQYRHLLAELVRRGWTRAELANLIGGNFLRILRKVELVAYKQRKRRADTMWWSARKGGFGR